jgi:Universal stress protein family
VGLVSAASAPGDLLIVGSGRRRALTRIAGGRVSRYCLAHARCPVLTIAPPPLARETRGAALARTFRYRTLTADQIPAGKHGSRAADAHPQTP